MSVIAEGLLHASLAVRTERLPAPLQVPSQGTSSASVPTHSANRLQCKPEHETRDSLETGLKSNWFTLKFWHSPDKKHKFGCFQLTTYEDAAKVQNELQTPEFVLHWKYETVFLVNSVIPC